MKKATKIVVGSLIVLGVLMGVVVGVGSII